MVFGALDIFVQCSKSEGMSNTILEAMASGLPVVSTNVGGADEMVIDGHTGVLVRAGGSESLASALDGLVSSVSTREAMGSAGRRRAHAEFSIETMIRGYEGLYHGVARHVAAGDRRGAYVQ